MTEFDKWLRFGMDRGWCGPAICETCDGSPTTEAEDDDDSLCVHVVRLYKDADQRSAVELNHSPSKWRAGVAR